MLQIVILAAATILMLGWLYLGRKYGDAFDKIIDTLDAELYQVPELFYIGFGIMDLIHFDLNSKRARKRIHEIAEINGKKYARYYYYVTKGAEFTYAYAVLLLMLLLSAMALEPMLAGLGCALAVLAVVYYEETVEDKLTERHDALLSEFPQVLSKLTLLVNSGMVMRDAWNKVAGTGTGVMYQEMQITMQEFRNGVSEVNAYRNFAERCALKEVRRFSSTMIQNLQKGNAEIAFFLREMADEMWEEKKHLAKRKGEAANSKMMLPTGIIFIGILVMIMIPVFSGMEM